jgi:hypothetical protein
VPQSQRVRQRVIVLPATFGAGNVTRSTTVSIPDR